MTLKGHNKFLLRCLNHLIAKYGEPFDIVGSFDVEDRFWQLLNTDSQRVKNKILKDLLQYFSDSGYNGKSGNRMTFENDAEANTIFLKCGVRGI